MATLNSFKELNCWKKGREIRVLVSKELIPQLPKREAFMLKDQILRASRSVTANIAEGYGRSHDKDRNRFFIHARASLNELLDHLSVCLDENYIEKHLHDKAESMILENLRLLNGFQRYLSSRKPK